MHSRIPVGEQLIRSKCATVSRWQSVEGLSAGAGKSEVVSKEWIDLADPPLGRPVGVLETSLPALLAKRSPTPRRLDSRPLLADNTFALRLRLFLMNPPCAGGVANE